MAILLILKKKCRKKLGDNILFYIFSDSFFICYSGIEQDSLLLFAAFGESFSLPVRSELKRVEYFALQIPRGNP